MDAGGGVCRAHLDADAASSGAAIAKEDPEVEAGDGE
jgi:hypothetical protein